MSVHTHVHVNNSHPPRIRRRLHIKICNEAEKERTIGPYLVTDMNGAALLHGGRKNLTIVKLGKVVRKQGWFAFRGVRCSQRPPRVNKEIIYYHIT